MRPRTFAKTLWWGIGLGCLLNLGPAQAQLELNLKLASDQVLVGETVTATVTLRNQTGQLLAFDAAPEAPRLRFNLEMGNGKLIPRADDGPVLSEVQVMPGATAELKVNLTRLYAIQAVGRYRVAAVVNWRGREYWSGNAFLEVVPGFELMRLSAGVPGDPMALRFYVLEYLQKARGEDLYLRIEDAHTQRIFGMYNLGRIVRVRPPDLRIDEAGNVHVLFQSAGLAFVHTAFTPYGVLLTSEKVVGAREKVRLEQLPDGRIVVYPQTPPVEEAPAPAASTKPPKTGSGGIFGRWFKE